MTELPDRRLLLVHAHPDDESINNGATMARYAAEGARVTLVTCTLGERGEVIPPGLAHLSGAALGGHRLGELKDAIREIGVEDFRLLGGAGRYCDSGMTGLPDNDDPGCFWQADVDQAAGLLAEVILEIRPQVVITYDDNGGYGHPDHIQAHRVAMRAVDLAAEQGWDIPKVYWSAMAESRFRATLKLLREAGDTETFSGMEPDADFGPFVTPDEHISARVDGSEYLDTKLAALARHRSQVETDGLFFRGSENGQSMWGEEFYRIAKGTPGPVGEDGWESDLFSGL